MYEIVVIGNPLYNTIAMPDIETKENLLSGPAVNISHVSAKLGIDNLAIIGAIGNDYREKMVTDLEYLGVPEYYAVESPQTGGFHIHCEDDGLPVLSLLGRARNLRILDIPEEFLDSKYIVLSPAFREIDIELIEWISNSTDAQIVLDTQGMGRDVDSQGMVFPSSNGGKLEQVLELVDVVKMERPLWRIVTDESDPLLAAEFLVEHGTDIGIAMLSSMGSVVYDGDEFYIVPMERSSTRNVIAASDAFLAAFTVGMLQAKNMAERAAFASGAASIVIEHSCAELSFAQDELDYRQQSIIDRIVIK
ncbi:MAG: PfkB family carbohydrate kinase [Candidatus Thorarchaeota archaeon]|nr:PfkB family carbohydrate kinase [Candidatus Thorarchaeota archaeon]